MRLKKTRKSDDGIVEFEWKSITTDDVIYRFSVLSKKSDHFCDLFELTALQCMYERCFKTSSSRVSEEEIRKWFMKRENETSYLGHGFDLHNEDQSKKTIVGEEKVSSETELSSNPLNHQKSVSNGTEIVVSCKKIPGDAHSLLEIIVDLFVFNPSSNEFLVFLRKAKVGLYSYPNFICKSLLIYTLYS